MKGDIQMQIVINLDEDIYTRLFDNGNPVSLTDRIVIEKAIRAGIVLPKGHGRLIDDNEVKELIKGWSTYAVDKALTVLEADREL